MVPNRFTLLTSIALALAVAPTFVAHADEKTEGEKKQEVSINDVPKPARDALVREAKGARITRIDRMTENGRTVFVAHLVARDGKESLAAVDSAGKPLQIREPGKEKTK